MRQCAAPPAGCLILQSATSCAHVVMSFPKLKLSYFDFPGRAGAIRMTFFLGGIPFDDHRFPRQDLAAFKPECPYGAVPILQVNDEVLAESQAIARYAGRLAGLYPVNNPSAALLMDEAMYAVDQFGERFRTWWAASSDETKKAEEAKLLDMIIPQSFQFIDRILEKTNQHPSLTDSSRLFIHEIWVHQFLATFLCAGFLPFVPTNVVDGYKHWEACVAKVDAHPRIQEWMAIEQLRANQVKLVSFPFNGRESAIRLALDIGGVPFEDDRVASRDAFSKRFPTVPSIHSLMLEVNGQSVATQPLAALIYVGKLGGLYPMNDPLAALRVDEVFGVLEAFYSAVLPALTETDADAKRSCEESLVTGDIAKHLSGLDSRIKKRGQVYATGTSLTVADLAIHGAITFLQRKTLAHVPVSITDEFPTLLSIHDRVATLAVPKP